MAQSAIYIDDNLSKRLDKYKYMHLLPQQGI